MNKNQKIYVPLSIKGKMKFEFILNSFALIVLFCCIFIAFFEYDFFVTGLAIVSFLWCLSSLLNLLNIYRKKEEIKK